MSKRDKEETLNQIEETQAALRDSIEDAKQLAAQSDRLIKLHRGEIGSASNENDVADPAEESQHQLRQK